MLCVPLSHNSVVRVASPQAFAWPKNFPTRCPCVVAARFDRGLSPAHTGRNTHKPITELIAVINFLDDVLRQSIYVVGLHMADRGDYP